MTATRPLKGPASFADAKLCSHLRDRMSQGIDATSAIRLTAVTFASLYGVHPGRLRIGSRWPGCSVQPAQLAQVKRAPVAPSRLGQPSSASHTSASEPTKRFRT